MNETESINDKPSQLLIFNNNPTLHDIIDARDNLNLIICRVFAKSYKEFVKKQKLILDEIDETSDNLYIDFDYELPKLSSLEYENKIKQKFNNTKQWIPLCSWEKS
jgi:hypothetical protein